MQAMNATNLVQRVRSIKYDSVLAYLRLAFKDFAYPVYLFGSYATGRFHGHSDVDILIIAPDTQSVQAYRQACNKMAGLGMNYDILTSPSIERLDSSIAASLQAIHDPCLPSAPRYRHQTGMTLIEIMIALLIGAFLLGGVLQVFLGSKQTYRMQENLSRLQENGRFAMEFLSKDIRMVGYWDCMAPSTTNNDISGTEGVAGAPDSITIRAAFARSRAVADICGKAVTAAATVACPQAAAPANFYTDNTSKIAYSINTVNNALQQITNCVTTDIVEGIENMQILYGVDTDAVGTANFGTPNYYVPANAAWVAADWAKVVSIRITITVRTTDGNLTSATVARPDGRITRNFTSTIALRNRLK
mgnify:CR=1 FL=1